jgi:hypothetical protein
MSERAEKTNNQQRIEAMEHDPMPPRPARERLIWLSLAIMMPPTLWVLQLLLLSAFTTYACFPAFTALASPRPSMDWIGALVLAADLIAILAATGSGLLALNYFRLTRGRIATHRDALSLWHLDRLCFMSLGGILSSAGFLCAIIFETIASLMVPPCA